MTTSCTTPPIKQPIQFPTEPVCPPWCAGHEGSYQEWETTIQGSRQRLHQQDPIVFGNVAVAASQLEDSERGMLEPRVEIADATGGLESFSEFGHGEAHELGLAIVRAADAVRRHHVTWEAGR